jgi:hypothetical protein
MLPESTAIRGHVMIAATLEIRSENAANLTEELQTFAYMAQQDDLIEIAKDVTAISPSLREDGSAPLGASAILEFVLQNPELLMMFIAKLTEFLRARFGKQDAQVRVIGDGEPVAFTIRDADIEGKLEKLRETLGAEVRVEVVDHSDVEDI